MTRSEAIEAVVAAARVYRLLNCTCAICVALRALDALPPEPALTGQVRYANRSMQAQIDAAVLAARRDERRKTVETIAKRHCYRCSILRVPVYVSMRARFEHNDGHHCESAFLWAWLADEENTYEP